MSDQYKGVEKIKTRFRPSNDKLFVKLKEGEFNLATLLTLERFAWMQGKKIVVDRAGKQYTIPELRKELEGGT